MNIWGIIGMGFVVIMAIAAMGHPAYMDSQQERYRRAKWHMEHLDLFEDERKANLARMQAWVDLQNSLLGWLIGDITIKDVR